METGLFTYAVVGLLIHLLIIVFGLRVIKNIKKRESEIFDIIQHSTLEKDRG